MKFRSSLVLVLIAVFSLPKASADYIFDVNTSVRALGMGNAYTAVVDDADSLFYNPAGLARNTAFSWRIVDGRAGISGVEAFDKLEGLQDQSSFSDTLRELYGEPVSVLAGAKTAITLPHLAVAVYDGADANISMHNPVYSSLEVNGVNDFGYALGTGFSLVPFVHMGMAVKKIKRTGTKTVFGPGIIGDEDPDAIESQVKNVGHGYALDFGSNIVIPAGPLQGVLAFAWKNVGHTSFRKESGSPGTPPSEPEEMAVGASVTVDAALVSVTPAIDFRYLNRNDIQLGKKINLGVELSMPLIDIRAGFNQGYYTLGASMGLGLLRVDAATYGVELGEYPGQKEDRRYLVQLILELGIDPNISFLGGGGGSDGKSGSRGRRRWIKQRR